MLGVCVLSLAREIASLASPFRRGCNARRFGHARRPAIAGHSQWRSPNDLKKLHPKVSILRGGRVTGLNIEIRFSRDGRAGARLIRIATARFGPRTIRRQIVSTVSRTGDDGRTGDSVAVEGAGRRWPRPDGTDRADAKKSAQEGGNLGRHGDRRARSPMPS